MRLVGLYVAPRRARAIVAVNPPCIGGLARATTAHATAVVDSTAGCRRGHGPRRVDGESVKPRGLDGWRASSERRRNSARKPGRRGYTNWTPGNARSQASWRKAKRGRGPDTSCGAGRTQLPHAALGAARSSADTYLLAAKPHGAGRPFRRCRQPPTGPRALFGAAVRTWHGQCFYGQA